MMSRQKPRLLILRAAAAWMTTGVMLPAADTQEIVELRPEAFPVVISNAGAYRLAGNVDFAQADVSGITVEHDDVVIDLAGYTLKGPGTGSGSGIRQGEEFKNLSISNGVLAGWHSGIRAAGSKSDIRAVTVSDSEVGILAGPFSTLSDCSPYSNATAGIVLGNGSLAKRCTAYGNGTGIEAGQDSELRECTAYANTGAGIRMTGNGDVAGCTSYENLAGMQLGGGVDVRSSVSRANQEDGIAAGSQCTFLEVTLNDNGRDGLRVDSGCEIRASTAHANAAAGIHLLGDGNRVDGSRASDNATGILVPSKGNVIEGNVCTGNRLKNFDIAEGNTASPMVGEEESASRIGERLNITDDP